MSSDTDRYAVIKTGGKQYRVAQGDKLRVEKLVGNVGDSISLGEVLLVGFGGLKQRLVKGSWVDEFADDPTGDLHGSWADGQGSFWVAGGDFISKAAPGKARRLIVARYGKGHVPTF